MNCCNDSGQCTQGFNCPARKKPQAPLTFLPADNSPQQEVISDLFWFVGFALAVIACCLVAGICWGLFERFYPSTACLVQQLFSITCK
jgi:hypothetical protein